MTSQYNSTCDSKMTGDVRIAITRHELADKKVNEAASVKSLNIHFKNVSELHISKVLFAVLFYDAGHNLLDTIEQQFSDFKPDDIRVINVETANASDNQIEGYEIKMRNIIALSKPVATGNDMVEIIKHHLLIGADPYDSASVSGLIELSIGAISLSIRNITDKVLSTIIFNAELYDIDNNLIDTIIHREYELNPFTSRAIMISSSKYEGNHAASYKVSVIKALTTETEKIQLRRHDRNSIANDGERIGGTLKNLSGNKADAAVIVTFLDSNNEKIETKVLPVNGIAPHSIRRFSLDFYPPPGEKVKSYTIDAGEMI